VEAEVLTDYKYQERSVFYDSSCV